MPRRLRLAAVLCKGEGQRTSHEEMRMGVGMKHHKEMGWAASSGTPPGLIFFPSPASFLFFLCSLRFFSAFCLLLRVFMRVFVFVCSFHGSFTGLP